MSVEWDTEQYANKQHDPHFEMEIYFKDKLKQLHVTQKIQQLCHLKTSSPKISVSGRYTDKEIHDYQGTKFEESNSKNLEKLKQKIIDAIKPLHNMTVDDIRSIIKYWFLSDIKYTAYRKAIMNVIKDKSINGIAIKDTLLKGLDIAAYLKNVIGEYIEDNAMNRIAQKMKNIEDIALKDTHSVAEIISNFYIEQIDKELNTEDDIDGDKVNGIWFVNTKNDKAIFADKLMRILSLSEDDAAQIYDLIQQYNVPTNGKIQKQIREEMRTINDAQTEKLLNMVNHEHIAIKLKQNLSLQTESEILMNAFYIFGEANDDSISKFYDIYASVFGEICLTEWYCSECCHHNRRIKIEEHILDPDEPLMQSCISCGFTKKNAIINLLKNKSKRKYLTSNINTGTNDEIPCDGTVTGCKSCKALLKFLKDYENDELDYASILSKLDISSTMQYIILPAIKNITDEQERNALIDKYECDEKQQLQLKITGDYLCIMQEHGFVCEFSMENPDISIGVVTHLYELIYQQCDEYVLKQRGASVKELVNIWKHCLQQHMDSSNGCEYNLFKCNQKECSGCKNKLNKCNNGVNNICAPKSRKRERFATLNNVDDHISSILSYSANGTSFNDHVKHQRRIDGFFQYKLDLIHTELLHKNLYKPKSVLIPALNPKPNLNRNSTLMNLKTSLAKPDTRNSTLMNFKTSLAKPDIRNEIELTEIHEGDIDVLDDDEMEYLYIKNKGKYASNITSYKFGEDHRYDYLGPVQGHKCFKDNILKSGFVSEELWNTKMSKSFSKLSIYPIKSLQYRADYCINRGDKMSVPHMMAVCFYTDVSKLCTDYRSTFRNLDNDASENVNQIRTRHGKYYFFSRFLYEAIEFFGNVMENEETVYHGLNKHFLFKDFITTFHAPTSTSPDKQSAVNFSEGIGIVLALRNGNMNMNDNWVISKFMKNQPRYLDASKFSDFTHEREFLFYGDNIIFTIHDIIDINNKEIPKGTIAELNLLQRVIENKKIEWKKEKKTIKRLCKNLKKTCKTNLKLLKMSEADENEWQKQLREEANSLEQQLVEYKSPSDFLNFAMDILQNERDASKEEFEDKRGWWAISSEIRSNLINIFRQYCIKHNMDGGMFGESRKALIKFFRAEDVKLRPVQQLHRLLRDRIAKHNSQIEKQIENNQKSRTEAFNGLYYEKLYHYFTVSRYDFICIQSLYNIPTKLLDVLFIDMQEK
eukprot:370309_1